MPSLLAELERLGDRRQYEAWVAQCSEEADEDAVRVVREPLLPCSAGELQREACLARPTRAGHRQQPRLLQQLVGVLEFPLTAEKRGRRGGKVRVRDRPERRKLPVAELEQAHRLVEVLQPMRSQRGERESVAEQARRRLGHHNLAAVTRRHHPGTAMHIDTDVPLPRQRRRTGMQTHPHPHRRRQQRRLRRFRGTHRSRRVGERAQKRIALRVHLCARVSGHRLSDQLSVLGQDVLVRGAELGEEPRRALDVGEEQSDGAGRQIGHGTARLGPGGAEARGDDRARRLGARGMAGDGGDELVALEREQARARCRAVIVAVRGTSRSSAISPKKLARARASPAGSPSIRHLDLARPRSRRSGRPGSPCVMTWLARRERDGARGAREALEGRRRQGHGEERDAAQQGQPRARAAARRRRCATQAAATASTTTTGRRMPADHERRTQARTPPRARRRGRRRAPSSRG